MMATGAAEWVRRSGPEIAPVGVLFAPQTTAVLDIFRALGDLDDHYDFIALDALESRLSAEMRRDIAKGVVSDALLLAFGLRRERAQALEFKALLSRRGTLDEYRLMGMIGAAFWHDFQLAREAAAVLGVRHAEPLLSLAFDVAHRLATAGIRLDAPDPRLLRVHLPTSSHQIPAGREICTDIWSSFDFKR